MTKLAERHLVAAEVLRDQGWSGRRIAKELGVDESTVRYRLWRRAEAAGDGRRRQVERCEVHAEVVAAWLERQAAAKRPESMRMLYEELVLEHGYTGSYQAVRRYVRRRVAVPAVRPSRRVETKPGAQAQIDWLETRLRLEDPGGWTKVSAFLMTLSTMIAYPQVANGASPAAGALRLRQTAPPPRSHASRPPYGSARPPPWRRPMSRGPRGTGEQALARLAWPPPGTRLAAVTISASEVPSEGGPSSPRSIP